jgi:hypothetical protein
MRNGAGKRTFRHVQYSKANLCTVRTHGREQTDDVSSTDWILEVTYTNSANVLLLSQYVLLRLSVRREETAVNVFLVQSFIILLKWEMHPVVSLSKRIQAKERDKSFRI